MSNVANPITDYESAPVSSKGLPGLEGKEIPHTVHVSDAVEEEGRRPTEEELATLPLVAASLPWPAVAMCLIEFAERASYYGSIGPFGNFIRRALPPGGNGAGGVAPGIEGQQQSAGALGLGLQTATALTTLFTFLAYTVPIFGGIVADTRWGRYKTVVVGTAVGAIAHILLVIPAIPSVIASGNALAPFIISLLILAFAAGFIKPCLGPLLCDQSPVTHQTVITNKKGKRVILDPAVTVSSYLTIFYWSINVGAFFSTATAYAARDVGFWLAFLTPGILYMMMPIVLALVAKRLYKAPPQGSVVKEFVQVLRAALGNGGWKRALKGGDTFWDRAKPSQILATQGAVDEKRIIWDDKFVDEIKQSLSACVIFLFIPVFNLSAGGMGNVEGAMGAAMTVNGVPNDLISNFNPLTIIIAAPVLNYLFYPAWQRMTGSPMKPMTRMSVGFMLGAINMVWGAILQWRVYETSPCGYRATSLGCEGVSPLSLWLQIPLSSLPAIGELFINVTSYEIAYTRAPARMKGLIYAAVLFTSSISSAVTLIVNATPALQDPYLIWSYVVIACLCTLCAGILPWKFSSMNNPVDDFADRNRMEGKDRRTEAQLETEEQDLDSKKA